ncbi:hypothetical protein SAMN05421762_3759 [Pseudooceanicola nitratireducens]|uniref:Uncharacterized protein n=1 Tax=Pseudooceanicola nitratireducens TaxID=517719 RepID=A0A1I1R058_9RHOB|nr:hypothetical protein SAMN05216183_10831 [Pseudooceanicola nitratireducens]SFD24913.1 hypothetical protein SAMN05421762_3759 [Pseudooceanicola nitratireducens]
MPVHFLTSSPEALLREFNQRIVQEDDWGKADGWLLQEGNAFYQHAEDVSDIGARLVPSMDADTLSFELQANAGKTVPLDVIKLYHTRLVETFLRWMDVRFDEIRLN